MSEMLKFHAEDWFEIAGRGRVASVRNPQRYDREACPYIGQVVEIDGERFTVLGVESFAISPIREGAPIGLLVGPPPPSPGEEK